MTTFFRPGLGLTVGVFISLAILIGLGTWQAQKIGPKSVIIAKIEVGLAAEPVSLPRQQADYASIDYRPVYFEGVIDAAKQIRIFGMNLSGKPGYYLYHPAALDAGGTVIVNIGWIAFDEPDKIVELARTAGRFTGIVRGPQSKGAFQEANDIAAGTFNYASMADLAQAFGKEDLLPVYIVLDAMTPGQTEPLPSQNRVGIPNNHFQYALTWYGLGLSLIAVYVAFGAQRAKDLRLKK